MAAKKATIVGDVTSLQLRKLDPSNIPHLVKKIKGILLMVSVKRRLRTADCRLQTTDQR